MRNTCQVTNQSSHGELSFHHNPHLRLCWGLGLFTSRVVRSGGSRLKNAALPTYCHCCEFCALKQKPGVLLENKKRLFEKENTHSFHAHTHVRKRTPRRAHAPPSPPTSSPRGVCVCGCGGVVCARCVSLSLSVCVYCVPFFFLRKHAFAFYTKNPNCRPYSSPHQVPKHRMLWYIEKGTLREVGKIDA